MRINPKKPEKGDLGYRIPGKNPFVDEKGRDEIWSIGLRNPFRFSFDGDNIAIGDVGQGAREEVDIVPIADRQGRRLPVARAARATIEGPTRTGRPTLPQIDADPRLPAARQPAGQRLARRSPSSAASSSATRASTGTAFDPATGRYLFAEAFTAPNVRSFVPDVGAQTISGLTSHPFGIDNVAGIWRGRAGARLHRLADRHRPPDRSGDAAAAAGPPPVGNGQGEVDLEQVGGSFDTPVNSAFAPGETDKVYVVEQGGTARVVVGGTDSARRHSSTSPTSPTTRASRAS